MRKGGERVVGAMVEWRLATRKHGWGGNVHGSGVSRDGAGGRERFRQEEVIPNSAVAFLAVAGKGFVLGDV